MLKRSLTSDTMMFASAPLVFVYGLLTAFVFQSREDDIWAMMTFTFLFLFPIALGALTILFLPKKHKTSWFNGIFAPWIPCAILSIVVAVLAWEALICVLMALPIFLFFSSIGGLFSVWLYRRNMVDTENDTSVIGVIMVLPFLFMPLESQLPLPDSIRTIETQVVIQADSETIWQNLIAVPEIQPSEARLTAFRALTLPMPVEATLSHEGLGGIRHATYSNGVQVIEPVIEWEPYKRFTFEVQLDPDAGTPPAPFEQVGGKYFEVREVGFTLEPLSDGHVMLRLRSTHRLSTHFNFYGGLWTDFLMQDFQHYILEVIKGRAEQ